MTFWTGPRTPFPRWVVENDVYITMLRVARRVELLLWQDGSVDLSLTQNIMQQLCT